MILLITTRVEVTDATTMVDTLFCLIETANAVDGAMIGHVGCDCMCGGTACDCTAGGFDPEKDCENCLDGFFGVDCCRVSAYNV